MFNGFIPRFVVPPALVVYYPVYGVPVIQPNIPPVQPIIPPPPPSPIQLTLGDTVKEVSYLGRVPSWKAVKTETKMRVIGCPSETQIKAVRGGTFVATPINWSREDHILWVHPAGSEDTHQRTQFEWLTRPKETRKAEYPLQEMHFYMVKGFRANIFYRAVLLRVGAEFSEVFFVDFGKRFVVSNSDLYETINEGVKKMEPSAVPVMTMSNDGEDPRSPANFEFERALRGEPVLLKLVCAQTHAFGVELVPSFQPANRKVEKAAEEVKAPNWWFNETGD